MSFVLTPEEINFIQTLASKSPRNAVTFVSAERTHGRVSLHFVGQPETYDEEDEAVVRAMVVADKDEMVVRGLLTKSIDPINMMPTYTLTEKALRLAQHAD
jgi:hypothetical protein